MHNANKEKMNQMIDLNCPTRKVSENFKKKKTSDNFQ